ncbi:hypothetical protein KP509_09G078000 [Ceratopteris richardii]|nr:hypothetical protein KP509_09G078000 [Ceratopteris richardii]
MLVAEGTKEEASKVDLEGIPGGAEGFELAAKFCYGMLPEINKHNVALLRCAAEFLDMSEEKGDQMPNLISLTEDFLERVMAKRSFKDIVIILQSCEPLLPLSEDIGIVTQCVECVVSTIIHSDSRRADEAQQTLITFHEFQHNATNNIDWWVEDLSLLGINFFQKVLSSLQKRGLKKESIGHALVYYAQKSLKSLTRKGMEPLEHGNAKSKVTAHDASIAVEHEQRVLVETIVSLIPQEKNVIPINFLMGMLRIAHILETTLACRLDLERRIASQLHKATLDDLLLPSPGKKSGEGLFDVDTVHNLVASFMEQQRDRDEYGDEEDDDASGDSFDDTRDGVSSAVGSVSPVVKVAKLVDGYLAEIAADAKLPLSKFLALAELIPANARPYADGLYRAVDISMKTHAGMTDVERKKICRLIDFQKLTPEACTHAAQNERLPVQAVVQVLYFEQMRIRNVMAGSHFPQMDEHPSPKGLQAHPHRHSPHGLSPHGSHHVPSLHSPESGSLSESHSRGHSVQSFGAHHGPFGAHQTDSSHQETSPALMHKISNRGLYAAISPHDQYASVRIENRELKQEVARMKMRLNDLERGHLHMKHDSVHGEKDHSQNSQGHTGQPAEDHRSQQCNSQLQHHHHHHHHGFFHAFSKSLSKLNPFHHHKLAPAPTPPAPQPVSSAITKRRARSYSVNDPPKREPSNKPPRRHSSS